MLSVTRPSSCRYVAGPLTTSKEYYESLAVKILEEDAVRRRNQEYISRVVATLRDQSPIPVVDPGLLRVPNWNHAAYGRFFLRVLEELCFEAWFVDGWEFSTGATKEFVFAVQRNVTCLDERGHPLTIGRGTELIYQAATFVQQLGLSDNVLTRRLAMLKNVRSR